MKEEQLVYGLRPVQQALRSGKEIDKIYIQSSLQGTIFPQLKPDLHGRKIYLQYVPIERLNRLTRNNHQGIIAVMSPIEYYDFESVVTKIFDEGRVPFIVMLDRVTDVRNLGAIARSCECAGVDAIVVAQHSSAQINEDAIKTSAGALLRLPVCRQVNLKTTLNLARQMGLTVYGATEKGNQLYTQANMTMPLIVVMGSEENGISSELLHMCDEKLKIPIKANIESLNVSVAAGVIMYEVVRQRGL